MQYWTQILNHSGPKPGPNPGRDLEIYDGRCGEDQPGGRAETYHYAAQALPVCIIDFHLECIAIIVRDPLIRIPNDLLHRSGLI